MRLRIQTLPPLPDLKVWFVPRPSSAAMSLNTILELKRALCHDIKHLQSQGIQPYDIRLLLDEFELLGDLPYHEVLRDGDLVCVQVLQEPRSNIEVSRKRRAVEDVENLESARKRRKKSVGKNVLKITRQRTSSSSSSGSSEPSSASSESPDSDHQSSESSESSESSSSCRFTSSSPSVPSLPTLQSSKAQKVETIARATTIPAVIPVPPGYGKPSTKSRNRRRRTKRQFEREEKEAELAPPQGVSEANLTPLRPGQAEESFEGNPGPTTTKSRGAATSQSQSTSIPESFLDNMNGEVMMASLRNKNKRKNFRQTMVAPAVRKIVFGVTGDAYLTASTSIQESNSAGLVTRESRELPENSNVVSTVSSLQTRIIPPSKLAALGLLPFNILVTSVEFGRQGKKKNRRSWDPCKEEQVVNKVQQFDWYGHDADNGNVYLPYGEDGDGQGDTVEQSAQFDWRAAETGWEHFSLIETQDQLYSGVLVCWQGLAINPQTFTPEHLLGVGRVEKVEGTCIIIRQISRPGTETAVAFGIANEGGDGEGQDEEYSWGDISNLGWKIVDFGKSI